MKCPICKVDHFMLCHSCPHNGQGAGVDYKGSPCEVCALDVNGKPRANDSRESGHGRIVSLEQIERYVSDEIPAGDFDEPGDESRNTILLDIVGRFCRMDIRTQFLIEQRCFFNRPLAEVTDSYRRTFHRNMTANGIAATLAAVKRQASPA